MELLKQILRLLDGWGMGDGDAIEFAPFEKMCWRKTMENHS